MRNNGDFMHGLLLLFRGVVGASGGFAQRFDKPRSAPGESAAVEFAAAVPQECRNTGVAAQLCQHFAVEHAAGDIVAGGAVFRDHGWDSLVGEIRAQLGYHAFHPDLVGVAAPVVLYSVNAESYGYVVVHRQDTSAVFVLRHSEPAVDGTDNIRIESGYKQVPPGIERAGIPYRVHKQLIDLVQQAVGVIVGDSAEIHCVHALKQEPFVVAAEMLCNLPPDIGVSHKHCVVVLRGAAQPGAVVAVVVHGEDNVHSVVVGVIRYLRHAVEPALVYVSGFVNMILPGYRQAHGVHTAVHQALEQFFGCRGVTAQGFGGVRSGIVARLQTVFQSQPEIPPDADIADKLLGGEVQHCRGRIAVIRFPTAEHLVHGQRTGTAFSGGTPREQNYGAEQNCQYFFHCGAPPYELYNDYITLDSACQIEMKTPLVFGDKGRKLLSFMPHSCSHRQSARD